MIIMTNKYILYDFFKLGRTWTINETNNNAICLFGLDYGVH